MMRAAAIALALTLTGCGPIGMIKAGTYLTSAGLAVTSADAIAGGMQRDQMDERIAAIEADMQALEAIAAALELEAAVQRVSMGICL